jgi:hypothetical protein
MMAFSVSMQDHPELAYAAQDYIDIYLNNWMLTLFFNN